MANLFEPPPKFDLPLVKGQDVIVDFKNRVPDSDPVEYVDYDAGTVVALIIDAPTPITATAVITGYHAVCRIESTACDAVKAGVLWRCRVTLPGSPTDDLVAMNGKTVRSDGK